MKKSIIYLLGIAVVIPAFMSCSDFLDQNPDLRTTLDSEEKIANILVSAYISGAGSYQLVAELSSDNVCDYGITKNYNQFYQDVYEWAEEVTSNNDAPRNIWSSNYNNIANANQALSAIEELGGPTTTRLKASKGEALICRAYSHFVLANMFCMPYHPATAGNYLGIPYMDHARDRPQPQVRTRNAPESLRDDRQGHRSSHSPDRRHGLFGSKIPLQLQGRLLLRLALLPFHAGLGQCHQIRDNGPDLQPVVAAARLRCNSSPAEQYQQASGVCQLGQHGQLPPPGRDIEQRTAFRLVLHRRPLFARQTAGNL